jgi:hypothetical protein
MNPAENCLRYLQSKNWTELSAVLADNKNAEHLANSGTFSIFETVFIDEIRRYEDETNEDLVIVASRIFQIDRLENSTFQLTETTRVKLAKYLFDRHPQEAYAKLLIKDSEAIAFLEKHKKDIQNKIDTDRLSANLNIKIGEHGKLQFDKSIFNSPQEKELFLAARKVLPNSILLPNTALSTIVDSKVCEYLNSITTKFFYNSTLDLCIVNAQTFMPEIFIELDSGWHDKPTQIEKDRMKDEIFKTAGLKLERLRKIKNKEMTEVFELYINKKYASIIE